MTHTPKKLISRKKRAKKIIKELKKLFPNPDMKLNYSNNWELLVAVILSAQCTDKMVNKVTSNLFKKYRKLDDYTKAKQGDFERDIHSTGFYHNKAKNILSTAKIIKKKHKGKIPNTMEELTALPGVARKTSNIVLGNAFGIIEGIAVDTHVKRLSKKFGLTDEDNPEKIERDLMEIISQKEWFIFTYLLIEYGRNYCTARTCPADHPLNKII